MFKISSIWRGIGHAGSLQFFIQALQWGFPVVAALLTGLAAWADGQPLWVILLASLAALVMSVLFVRLLVPVLDRYAAWRENKRLAALPRPRLSIETRRAKLPTKVPPGGDVRTSRVMFYNDTISLSRGSLVFQETEHAIDWGREGQDDAERMAITNYGTEPLGAVLLTFDAKVEECVKTDGGTKSGDVIAQREVQLLVDLVPADAGHPAVIYFSNETPYFASLSLTEAQAKPFGGEFVTADVETGFMGHAITLFPAARFDQ